MYLYFSVSFVAADGLLENALSILLGGRTTPWGRVGILYTKVQRDLRYTKMAAAAAAAVSFAVF